MKKALQMNPGIKHVLVEGVGHNLGMNLGEEPIDVEPILILLNPSGKQNLNVESGYARA